MNNFASGTTLYPLQDLLYRTAALADTARVLREAYDTDAYGNTLIFRNGGTPPTAINFISDAQVSVPTCPFIFTGQRFDAETGLYAYKRRYFSPVLGRFIGKDPLFFGPGDANLTEYSSSAPCRYLEPYGLQICLELFFEADPLLVPRYGGVDIDPMPGAGWVRPGFARPMFDTPPSCGPTPPAPIVPPRPFIPVDPIPPLFFPTCPAPGTGSTPSPAPQPSPAPEPPLKYEPCRPKWCPDVRPPDCRPSGPVPRPYIEYRPEYVPLPRPHIEYRAETRNDSCYCMCLKPETKHGSRGPNPIGRMTRSACKSYPYTHPQYEYCYCKGDP